MMPSIRVAGPEDADAVSRLLLASYSAMLPSAYPVDLLARILPVMTRAQPALLASGRSFLAERDGEIVGYGGWSAEEPGSREVRSGLGHLRHFAVHPTSARQGVARGIVQACAGQALADDRRHWRVLASLNAVPFYRALGLEALRQDTMRMGSASMAVCVMEGPIISGTQTKTPG